MPAARRGSKSAPDAICSTTPSEEYVASGFVKTKWNRSHCCCRGARQSIISPIHAWMPDARCDGSPLFDIEMLTSPTRRSLGWPPSISVSKTGPPSQRASVYHLSSPSSLHFPTAFRSGRVRFTSTGRSSASAGSPAALAARFILRCDAQKEKKEKGKKKGGRRVNTEDTASAILTTFFPFSPPWEERLTLQPSLKRWLKI